MMHVLSVTLGSEITHVTGTVNGVPSKWTLFGEHTWQTTCARTTDSQYEIKLTAYDAAGNRADYQTILHYGVDCRLDWTVNDCLNSEDLNRIETNCKTLHDVLHGLGYTTNIKTRTWDKSDFPHPSEMKRIRNNINEMKDKFYVFPEWIDIVQAFRRDGRETLNAEQIFAMEWDMNVLYIWIDRMNAHMYAGEIFGGEPA